MARGDCGDPKCPGWGIFNDRFEIERCDACDIYASDEEAAEHVQLLLEKERVGYPEHVRIDSSMNYIRCDRCGAAYQILLGNAREVMKYLSDFCDAHALCHREPVVNKLRAYIHHFPHCPCAEGDASRECSCGLDQILKELGEEEDAG